MKTKIVKVMLILAVVVLACACKKTTETTTISTDTAITSFKIKHPRLKIDTTKTFIIDNTQNLIYNSDSLPFQTPIDSLIPTISGTLLSKVLINDTITYSGNDTLNFSQPVKLQSFAEDSLLSQTYTVKVNVHQVDPDLYVWQPVATIYSEDATEDKAFSRGDSLFLFVKTAENNLLFTSVDAKNWQKNSIESLPTSVSLQKMILAKNHFLVAENGKLFKSSNGINWSESTLSANLQSLLFELNDKIFACGNDSIFESTDLISWKNVAAIPAKFPISGAAITVARTPNGSRIAYIAGGKTADEQCLNTVWSTNNGTYWTELTEGKTYFSHRCGAALVQYDGKLMLFGGRSQCQLVTDDRHWISANYGFFWTRASEKITIPDTFSGRFNMSAVVDSRNRICLIGGQDMLQLKKEILVGKKNEFSFIIR